MLKLINDFKISQKRISNKIFLFILVLYLILAGLLLNPDLPIEGDSPIFFNLAQSISSGNGYKDIYFPGNPSHIQYPYCYPCLLALVIVLFPKTIVGLKFFSILFGAASLIAIQILFFNRDKTHGANLKISHLFLISLLTITNLWFLSFSVILLPEMLYFFFSLLTLIISNAYIRQKSLVNRYLWILFVCLGLTFYTKTIGMSLFLAITVYLFFIVKEYKKGFLILGWEVFLILFWIKFLVSVPAQSSQPIISLNYIAQLSSDNVFFFLPKIKLIFNNLSGYFQSISSLFLPVYFLGEETFEARRYCFLLYGLINEIIFFNPRSFLFFSRALIIFIGSVTCFGFLHQFKDKDLNEIYVTCYLLVLLFSPKEFYSYSSNRYLLMLFPFLIYYFLKGISLVLSCTKKDTTKERGKKFEHKILYVLCGILLIGNLLPAIFWIKNNISYVTNYKHLSNKEKKYYHPFLIWDFFSSAYWIKENTPPEVVIMHFNPPGFYLYSKRQTVFFDQFPYKLRRTMLEEIKLIIKEKKVDYIIKSYQLQEEIIYLLNKELENYIITPLVRFSKEVIYKVVKISPEVKLLNNEGLYWYNEENYGRAITEFEKSIKIKPNFSTFYQLGQCYEAKNMFNQALEMYEKSISYQPNYEIAKSKSISVLHILENINNK